MRERVRCPGSPQAFQFERERCLENPRVAINIDGRCLDLGSVRQVQAWVLFDRFGCSE